MAGNTGSQPSIRARPPEAVSHVWLSLCISGILCILCTLRCTGFRGWKPWFYWLSACFCTLCIFRGNTKPEKRIAQFPTSILPTVPLPAPTLARLHRQFLGVGWTGARRHMYFSSLSIKHPALVCICFMRRIIQAGEEN